LPAQAAQSGGSPKASEWFGAVSPYEQFSAQVIRDSGAWSSICRKMSRTPPRDLAAPEEMALAVFLGLRRTAGYDLAIERVGQAGSVQLFRARELAPAQDAFVAQVLTTPYRILIMPASTVAVSFLIRFDGVASGECLYIPAGERQHAERAAQLPGYPNCPKTPMWPIEGCKC
jgi:hypothetical protein